MIIEKIPDRGCDVSHSPSSPITLEYLVLPGVPLIARLDTTFGMSAAPRASGSSVRTPSEATEAALAALQPSCTQSPSHLEIASPRAHERPQSQHGSVLSYRAFTRFLSRNFAVCVT